MATHLWHTGWLASDKNWKPDLPRDYITAAADLGLVTYISEQSENKEVGTLSELCWRNVKMLLTSPPRPR